MSQIIASIKIAEPDADGNTYHVVQNGQSLWSIASAYGVKIEDVAAWNNIKDPAAIALNQKLLIPSAVDLLRQAYRRLWGGVYLPRFGGAGGTGSQHGGCSDLSQDRSG